MTQTEKHLDFTLRLMPKLERIARRRFRGERDRDDRTADFIVRGWEAYVSCVHRGRPPSVRAVVREANTRWRESEDLLDQPSAKMRSLSDATVRRVVEQIPA